MLKLVYLNLSNVQGLLLPKDIDNALGSTVDQETTSGGLQCDVTMQGNFCFGDGSYVYSEPAVRPSALLYYSFDTNMAVDNSGNQHHGVGYIRAGPSFNSSSSALFDQEYLRTHLYIPTDRFTIAFWLFVYKRGSEEENKRFCPIVSYGPEGSKTRVPDVSLQYDTNRLRVSYSCEGDDLYALSNAKLPYSRWHNIIVTRNKDRVALYINGILDTSFLITAPLTISPKSSVLLIGGTPETIGSCDGPVLMEDFWVMSDAWNQQTIWSHVGSIALNASPSEVQFVCTECTLVETAKSCRSGCQPCGENDMYRVSRVVNANGYELKKLAAGKDSGLGMCCC